MYETTLHTVQANLQFAAVLALLAAPGFAPAQRQLLRDDVGEQVRMYKTPEARREAGLKYQIARRLAVSGLTEFQYLHQRFSVYDTDAVCGGRLDPLLRGALVDLQV